MTKSSSGRKTTPRKKSTGRKTASTRKPASRRNPAPATRRNPSFMSRATTAYSKAGAAVLGGIAAEQAQNIVGSYAAGKVPGATVIAALAPGGLGVYLMGNKSETVKNIGLGMVITSAANVIGAVTSMLGVGAASGGSSTGGSRDTATQDKGRSLAAPQARALAAPAGSYGSACGCDSPRVTNGVRLPQGF